MDAADACTDRKRLFVKPGQLTLKVVPFFPVWRPRALLALENFDSLGPRKAGQAVHSSLASIGGNERGKPAK